MIFFNFLGSRSRVQEIKCDWGGAEENQRGIVIRLSNKNHLHRLSCKRLLKLVQAGLHREQKGIERLQDGFASCAKGH